MRFELHEDTWNSVTDGLYFEDYFNGHYIKTNKQINYFDDILAFDIETSSFREAPEDVIERDTEVYSYLLGTKIRISDSFFKEFPAFNDIRRSLFGRMYFSKSDGISVDSLYHDLNNMFPYYFPEDIYNPYDCLEKILEVFFDNAPDNDDFNDKRAVMYVWQLAINGKVIIGRTWDEFVDILNEISAKYHLDHNQRMIVWVHNLSFEFSFLKDYFEWDRVFAIAPRKPIYALTTTGIEFRCSYILSNLSLDNLSKSLTMFPVRKLVGNLDYELVRHSETPLTEDELRYCINDVLVVSSYIYEQCKKEGNITKLPLTATGYCRKFARTNCLRGSTNKGKNIQYSTYQKLMKNCQITSVAEYQLMVRAFAGGFTHCSTRYSGRTLHDVDSFDFTSSYPYVLCSEKMPMSRGKKVEVKTYKELNEYCHLYCCIFDVKFINIKPKYINENYISTSKCYKCVNPVTNNGRLVGADLIQISITNVDYEIIAKTYEWDAIEIGDFYIYKKDYLPREIIVDSIVKLYNDKTKLKGVKGQEDFYTKGKQLLNSVYGMMVTSIIMPIHSYDGTEWTVEHKDLESELKSYNKSKKRFLFYPWGVFCTAYARRNLWSGILAFGDDYIYSDTDSIKAVHAERHMDYIRSYNRLVERKLKLTAAHFNIPFEVFAPKTIKGETKMLGVWDCETEKRKDGSGGPWKMFRSLGAKRYMVLESDGNLTITVSGVNKKSAVPYLLEKYGKEGSFKAFNEDLVIPAEHTGKLTHYYLDEPMEGYVTDYLGKTIKYKAKSGVYLEKASYVFSMEAAYLDYLKQVRGELI